MKILINYATPKFARHRRINTATGYALGGFDKVIEYSPQDIDEDFRRKNERILNQKKGGGYWLWKPYIIRRTLQGMEEGDFLFYADAGSCFTGPVEPLIEVMGQKNQDILLFQMTHLERHWTKRDVFTLMGCDTAEYADTGQFMAGFSLWRKTAFSLNLADEWLSYAQDERIIMDIPNQNGKDNYPGFRENRHDQSIWSLLCKKYQLKEYKTPPQPRVFHNRGDRGYRRFRRVDSCFILSFRENLKHCGYLCLRHPMKLRLNFLILKEVGWAACSEFLEYCLIKIPLVRRIFRTARRIFRTAQTPKQTPT